MASADVEQPPSAHRDVSGGSSLLSKFARSPSRKHKLRPSSESIHNDVILNNAVAAGKPTRHRPRPGNQRTNTTPDAPLTLNSFKVEPAGRKDSNATDSTEVASPDSERDMYTVTTIPLSEAVRPPKFVVKKPDTMPDKATEKKPDGTSIPEVPIINSQMLAVNPYLASVGVHNAPNPNTLYQHIHDMSSKRIATLDYMRKA